MVCRSECGFKKSQQASLPPPPTNRQTNKQKPGREQDQICILNHSCSSSAVLQLKVEMLHRAAAVTKVREMMRLATGGEPRAV